MDQGVDRFSRTRALFGDDFEKFSKAKILLLGVGGVGSYCLESLYRTGFRDITIVDFDRYDVTNQNRQLGSEHLGEIKVEVLAKMFPGITPVHQKIDVEWVEKQNFKEYHVVLDAVDDVRVKVEVAKRAYSRLISSMGSAMKYDPSQIKVGKIWETEQDSLAKVVKNQLKLHKFKETYTVVYSTEGIKGEKKGSFMGVTATFGLQLSSLTVQRVQRLDYL